MFVGEATKDRKSVCVYVCEREKVAIKNIYLLCPYIYLQIVMYLIQLLHLIPLLYDMVC